MKSKMEEILAFTQVVEHKSFTKAADVLGVEKSSLSRRINELEKRLGVQLLQRTTRHLFLTEQGEGFFEKSRQILAAIDEMDNAASEAQVELKGRIKIAVPISFAQRNLASLFSQFIALYPHVDLIVDLNDRQIDLIEDGFDLAIRIGELKDSSLIAKRLADISFITCASPEYFNKYGKPQKPNDLKTHKGLFYTHVAEKNLWRYGVGSKTEHCPPIKTMSANNGDFLAQVAANGGGIIRSPLFIVKPYIKEGSLIEILQEYEKTIEGIYAVFPPGRLIPVRIRKLVDFLKEQFAIQDKNND